MGRQSKGKRRYANMCSSDRSSCGQFVAPNVRGKEQICFEMDDDDDEENTAQDLGDSDNESVDDSDNESVDDRGRTLA